MLTRVTKPFVLIAVFVLVVGMACSLFGGDTTTPEPQQLPPEQPPAQDVPTQAPPPTAEPPTAEPQPEPSARFFTEQFDQDPGDLWSYSLIYDKNSAKEEDVSYVFDFGRMIFELNSGGLYAYYIYTPEAYDDVRVGINFENRGVNSQQMSLVCRRSDEGWYEYSVQSDGLWYLYAITYNSNDDPIYNFIANGGSTKINQGKAVNEYSMECIGDKIHLYINGEEVKQSPISERKYAFRRGNVGFNVSSLRAFPVKVEIDWFEISEP